MAAAKLCNSPHIQRRENEKGFAILSWLLISSVFFSAALLLGHFSALLKDRLHKQKICTRASWRYQQKQKQNLESLLSLNSEALILRTRYKQAQKNLIKASATGNPGAIAAAKAYLLAVQLQKIRLASRQKRILLQADIERQTLNRALHSQLRTSQTLSFQSGLAVRPDSYIETAPTYSPLAEFSSKQTAGARWQKTIPGQCYVTLERRNTKWFVVLSAGKSSANFSLL